MVSLDILASPVKGGGEMLTRTGRIRNGAKKETSKLMNKCPNLNSK